MMLLVLLASRIVPPPATVITGAVDVVFSRAATPAKPEPAVAAPAPPPPEPVPTPPPPEPVKAPEPAPPPPEPVKVAAPPAVPAPVAETAPLPPPPRKPLARTARRVAPRSARPPARETVASAEALQYPAPAMPGAVAPAALAPGPDPAIRYVAMIKAWLERHKRYPDAARQAGEEGSAALRFRVDRYGSVLGYTMLASTGHPDLDAGIGEMMREARLPPFPPDMPGSQVDISVTIRFNLTR